jgi:GNAT superfamily N-acetyltransferase
LAEFFDQRCAADLGPDRIRLVAERDQRLAGFLTAHLRRPVPEDRYQMVRQSAGTVLLIEALLVAGWARRAGVAAALLAAAHRWGARAGAAWASLDTYADSPSSMQFYRFMGYTQRAVVLDRPLTPSEPAPTQPHPRPHTTTQTA